MSAGLTKRIRRGLISCLRPMTGDYSTGQVTAAASSGAGTVTIPRNCHLVPILESKAGRAEISHDLPFRVVAAVDVPEAGGTVELASLLGGAANNLKAGTQLKWDPPLVGLEPLVTVDDDFTGGAAATEGPGLVREIRAFETLESYQQSRDLFAGEVGRLPALVVAYAGSREVDVLGEDRVLEAHRWRIYAITSWGGSAIDVGNEVTDLLDAAKGFLIRRSSSHGLVFSTPPIQRVNTSRVRVTPTSFVWVLDLETYNGVVQTDFRPFEGRTFNEWLENEFDLTSETTAYPTPLAVVDGANYDHDTDPKPE